MSKKPERRKHARHDTRFEVRLGGHGVAAREAIATEGLNVSMGGIYCQVPHFIPVLTKLRGALVLPVPAADGGEPIEEILESDMIVVWTDPESEIPGCGSYQIGCSFLFLDERQKGTLHRYLDHLAGKALT
jgi:hypothetical protein